MAISKKLRFEVFKRDSFKCQYCGRSSPDVILHADHVHPESKGGATDILNLVTSCIDCNLGKGARTLSDDSVISKQRDQLELLNERREQLEMMIQWKKLVANIDNDAVERLIIHWRELAPGWKPVDNVKRDFSKIVRKYGVEAVMDAMQIAADQYLVFDGQNVTSDSWGLAWGKIKGICRVNEEAKGKPYIRDLYYIKGILRNRGCGHKTDVMSVLKEAINVNVTIDQLKDLAARVKSWREFESIIENTVRDRTK